jgi:hypothetical protein
MLSDAQPLLDRAAQIDLPVRGEDFRSCFKSCCLHWIFEAWYWLVDRAMRLVFTKCQVWKIGWTVLGKVSKVDIDQQIIV